MRRRVVVTGLGVVSPLGVGVARVWSRLVRGRCGIRRIPWESAGEGPGSEGDARREEDTENAQKTEKNAVPRGEGRTRPLRPSAQWSSLTSSVAGMVPAAEWHPDEWHLSATDQRRMARFTQYALAATEMALRDARWHAWARDNPSVCESTGVSIGTGVGGFEDIQTEVPIFHEGGQRKVSAFFMPKILSNMAAGQIGIRYGFQGPGDCHSTACTTGSDSIGSAFRSIVYGEADVMVAGGTEASIDPLGMAGFGRVRSLSTAFPDRPEATSRPFDQDRCGFVIAEGAAVLLLEEREHALRRGATVYAEVCGYGRSMDAYHVTSPPVDGAGAYLAMKRALDDADVPAEHLDYINAHATGTPIGDAAEAAAIYRLLTENGETPDDDDDEGACRQYNSKPSTSNSTTTTIGSTKGATGHLLGAAGAIEALFTVLAIHHGVIPPALNLVRPDVGPLPSKKLNFVRETAQQKPVRWALSNSFGFGGMNASLVFSHGGQPHSANSK